MKKHIYLLYGLLISTWVAFIVYGASNHLLSKFTVYKKHILSEANAEGNPTPSLSANYSCPSTWNEFTIDNRRQCLKYVGVHKADLASFICSAVQAHVPLPENEIENKDYLEAFLQMFTSMDRKSVNFVALGLNDLYKRQNFAKTTGELAEWLNWHTGEPSHDTEHFVGMVTLTVPGKWADVNQNHEIDVFCEMAPVATPPTKGADSISPGILLLQTSVSQDVLSTEFKKEKSASEMEYPKKCNKCSKIELSSKKKSHSYFDAKP